MQVPRQALVAAQQGADLVLVDAAIAGYCLGQGSFQTSLQALHHVRSLIYQAAECFRAGARVAAARARSRTAVTP